MAPAHPVSADFPASPLELPATPGRSPAPACRTPPSRPRATRTSHSTARDTSPCRLPLRLCTPRPYPPLPPHSLYLRCLPRIALRPVCAGESISSLTTAVPHARPHPTSVRLADTTPVAPSAAAPRPTLSIPTLPKAVCTPTPGSPSQMPAPSKPRCVRPAPSNSPASTPTPLAIQTDDRRLSSCPTCPLSGLLLSFVPEDTLSSPLCSPGGRLLPSESRSRTQPLCKPSHSIAGSICANLWYTASASLLVGSWLGTVYPISLRLARLIIFPRHPRFHPS